MPSSGALALSVLLKSRPWSSSSGIGLRKSTEWPFSTCSGSTSSMKITMCELPYERGDREEIKLQARAAGPFITTGGPYLIPLHFKSPFDTILSHS